MLSAHIQTNTAELIRQHFDKMLSDETQKSKQHKFLKAKKIFYF